MVISKQWLEFCPATKFRKILVSVNFLSAILGPEMGTSILWAPVLSPGKSHVHLTCFRGGYFGFWGGGNADFIFMGAGIFPKTVARVLSGDQFFYPAFNNVSAIPRLVPPLTSVPSPRLLSPRLDFLDFTSFLPPSTLFLPLLGQESRAMLWKPCSQTFGRHLLASLVAQHCEPPPIAL